jgi:hypothetical protein
MNVHKVHTTVTTTPIVPITSDHFRVHATSDSQEAV